MNADCGTIPIDGRKKLNFKTAHRDFNVNDRLYSMLIFSFIKTKVVL